MPPAAGPAMQCDRVSAGQIVMPTPVQSAPPVAMTETFAKDAIIAWFRGEFAAANAIIDALCSHIAQQYGGGDSGSEYESVFSAIHRRRLNWIPILQMQKYYSIADVALQLRRVADMTAKNGEDTEDLKICQEVKVFTDDTEKIREISEGETTESCENGCDVVVVDEDSVRDVSPDSEITDSGSQEIQPTDGTINVCCNHKDCEERRSNIKLTKGFIAKEPVKGRTVNIVRGLKLYDDIFNEKELSKINEFVYELVIAGRNGELPGETYVLYNQQTKGKKRELIQFGPPIFGHIKGDLTDKDETSHIEPIPVLLQSVIDHLAQWHLISENRKPDSCIINYFDEGEFSPPFLKPPHLEQPISILNLSVSTMAFGRTLVSDNEGNYKGPLMLPLKEGSLLVMRGNSSEVARHVMCPSPNKRATLTFFRVRPDSSQNNMVCSPPTMASVWPSPGYGTPNGYEETDMIPKWGVLRAPVVMLAPVGPMVINPKKMLPRGGTGVFLPWSMRPRKPAKHLPPRAQKNRLLSLPPPPPPAAVTEDGKMSSGVEEGKRVSVSY